MTSTGTGMAKKELSKPNLKACIGRSTIIETEAQMAKIKTCNIDNRYCSCYCNRFCFDIKNEKEESTNFPL